MLEYLLKQYVNKGRQFAYIRRYAEDLKKSKGCEVFSALVNNKVVYNLTNGEWSGISYETSKFYFNRYDENENKIIKSEVIGYAFTLAEMEHYKSFSYPNVYEILFEEFITRGYYLGDEFILFQNMLSTIIRDKNDVKIFMLGNSVNKYNPYFVEMGLTNAKNQKQNTIDIYEYGNSGLKVAVEYTESISSKKECSKYFAFDNPRLKMITTGAWEIDIYPHLPKKYNPKNVLYRFYIEYDKDIMQCNIISIDNDNFIYIHPKTTPIKDDNLIYTSEYSCKSNYRRKIGIGLTKLENIITLLFRLDKVFYSSNEVGEVINNYLKWCGLK